MKYRDPKYLKSKRSLIDPYRTDEEKKEDMYGFFFIVGIFIILTLLIVIRAIYSEQITSYIVWLIK